MVDTTKLAKLEDAWREANVAMWAEQTKKSKYIEVECATRSAPLHRAAEEADEKIREEAQRFNGAISEANEKVKAIHRQIEAERNRLSNEKSPWHAEGTRVRRYRYLRSNAPPIKTQDVGTVEVFGPGSAWPANIRGEPSHGTLGVRLMRADGKPGKTFVRVSEFNRVDWRVEEQQ